jgi:hypothetical protein
MYLGNTTAYIALHHTLHIIHRHIPRLGTALGLTIGAELTIEDADIRWLEVEVAVEIDFVATHSPLTLQSKLAETP